ncbi:MAG: aminopeptidase P family protein [Nocardioidaceae bacterium]
MSDEAQQVETVEKPATRSHDEGVSEAYLQFMRTGWADPPVDSPEEPVATWAAKRRSRLAERFADDVVVVPAGAPKVRNNDCDYPFRVDSAHVWLTGNQESDAVFVLDHGQPTLYFRPRASRQTDEFFRDARYGEFWVGRRPSLAETEERLGLPCRPIDDLTAMLDKADNARLLRGVDPGVDASVAASDADRDRELATALSEMRLVKDAWEIDQMQIAVDITARGFDDCLGEWDQVLTHGERWIDGTFYRRARTDGNNVGYHSIVGAGSHATVLHWNDNDGAVNRGDLLLLDMGVEAKSLYTADITRTLPVSGTFTPLQRDLYTLVFNAQDAGMAAVRPGAAYKAFHQAAMSVLAHGLSDLGLLPVSAEEALDPESMVYRRWTIHGTGHMLGLDVHDCAQAAPASYREGTLAAGHVLTVEPGLYFQTDDELVPEELRGTGIRIEDDLLVTEDGNRNLSAALPRTPDDVEAWMGRLR